LLCGLVPATAQQSGKDAGAVDSVQNFYDMTLEQLMGLELTVASTQAMTTREAPGIVTLITEEEIESSSARDLMDILRMVPGFDFCVDVEGVVGVAVRGNWSHEGKALLLIDGLEMNENLYSTLQFGSHYPVQNIKRIEIIRGPGSAMYGGNAEYAVINIISKTPEELSGGNARITYGQMTGVSGQYSADVVAGNQFKDFGIAVNVYSGKAIRSDRTYTDFEGGSYDMEDHSDLQSTFINIGMQYKKLQFRGIIDKYSVDSKDNYDLITTNTYPVKFDSYIGELKQDIAITKKLVITPRVNLKIQLPWRCDVEILNKEVKYFDVQSSRYTGGFNSIWSPADKLNISGGAEYFYDIAQQIGSDVFVSNQSGTLDYNNTAVFAQVSWKNKIADINAGARYNYNDRFASSFVPRISVVKVFEKMHFKLLYSEAYRAPNTENIDLNPDIGPEQTTVIEFEAGVKLLPSIYLTGNVYDITTKDPIIFFYDNSTDQDGYLNASQTGTQGVEFKLQWKFPKGYVDLSYGYYSAANKNDLEANAVPGNKEALLAIPNHEFTLASNFQLSKRLSLAPSACFMGSRYGVIGIDATDNPIIDEFEPVLLLNISLQANELLVKGLSAGISMFNLLDQKESYLQPYTGGHAELPGRSRELVVNVAYKFTKK